MLRFVVRSDPNRPVPQARAEVVATAERWLHDVKAYWLLGSIVTATACAIFVPIGELLAEEKPLLLLPGLVFLFAPVIALRAGTAHARSLVRRRLLALVETAARRHGASPVEVEPVVQDEVRSLLERE